MCQINCAILREVGAYNPRSRTPGVDSITPKPLQCGKLLFRL